MRTEQEILKQIGLYNEVLEGLKSKIKDGGLTNDFSLENQNEYIRIINSMKTIDERVLILNWVLNKTEGE